MSPIHPLHLINHNLRPTEPGMSGRSTICYIAGPMRGVPYFNFPAFEEAAQVLREHGWFVYSPRENDAENGVEIHGEAARHGDAEAVLPLKDYMVTDLAQVCKSDAVFFLPGWTESRGAMLEFRVASYLDIPCYQYGDWGKILVMGTSDDGDLILSLSYEHLEELASPVGYRTPNEEIRDAYIKHQQERERRIFGMSIEDEIALEEMRASGEYRTVAERRAEAKAIEGQQKEDPSAKATNPKDAVGSDKIPVHLWPEAATVVGSLGMLDGMLKYGRANWREAGIRISIYVDALRRHTNAFFEGENIDPDSGLPHLSHMLACIAIIVDADSQGQIVDDRQYSGGIQGYRDTVEILTPHVKRLKEKHAGKDPHHYTIQDDIAQVHTAQSDHCPTATCSGCPDPAACAALRETLRRFDG